MRQKGFRQEKEKGSKQQLKELSTAVNNLQMGLKIAQMVSQQQMQNVGRLDADMQRVYGVTQNLDYRTRAVLELLDVDSEKLNEVADRLRLEDFNKQSAEEDEKLGFISDDEGVVTENSIVILTSTTNEENDAGIFRTKFHINDSPLPTIKEKLLGLKVNETFEDKVNGVDHTFTLLGIRLAPAKEETEEVAKVELAAVPNKVEKSTGEDYDNAEESNG